MVDDVRDHEVLGLALSDFRATARPNCFGDPLEIGHKVDGLHALELAPLEPTPARGGLFEKQGGSSQVLTRWVVTVVPRHPSQVEARCGSRCPYCGLSGSSKIIGELAALARLRK